MSSCILGFTEARIREQSNQSQCTPKRKACLTLDSDGDVLMIGEESSADPFSRLPLDCIFNIFRYLDIKQLARCGIVSRKFGQVSNHNSLWRDLYTLEFSHLSLLNPRLCPKGPKKWKLEFRRETLEYSRQVENVATYAQSIYEFLLEKESKISHVRYFDGQPHIEPKHRAIVVNWLSEVCLHLSLLPDTFFLCIQILDRYVQHVVVRKEEFQLIGISALLIASKLEELKSKQVAVVTLAYLAMTTPTKIRATEVKILTTLNFDFNYATPMLFLRRFSVGAKSDFLVHNMSKYLVELSTLAYCMLAFSPSMIAASSVYIARKMLVNIQTWTPTLECFSKFRESQLKPCVRHLNDILILSQLKDIPSNLSIRKPWLKDVAVRNSKRQMKFDVIKKKYSSGNPYRVALIPAIPTSRII